MRKRSGNTWLDGRGADGTGVARGRRTGMDPDRAEEIAIAALGFLAEEPQRLVRFLQVTGMQPAQLGAQAGQAHIQVAILDYLLADETLLLVFATEKHIDPLLLAPAQALLSGGGFEA